MNKPKHIWFAVDEREKAFEKEPKRMGEIWVSPSWDADCICLPLGSIEKITGRKITWKDKPIKWQP